MMKLSNKLKTLLVFAIVSILIITVALIVVLGNRSIKIKWIVGGSIRDPKVVDIDQDGLYEIIGCSHSENVIVCFDSYGGEIWSHPIREDGSILIGDLNLDNITEIVCTSYIYSPIESSLISCLSLNGEVLWEESIEFHLFRGIKIIDIDDDSFEEVVLSDSESMFILDSVGDIKYEIEADTRVNPSIIEDIDKDGLIELVHFSIPSILCYDFVGNLKWNYTVNIPFIDQPDYFLKRFCIDIEQDGYFEIAAIMRAGDKNIFISLNAFGDFIDSFEIKYLYNSVSIIDIDNSGQSEIIISTMYNEIVCYNFSGSERWKFSDLKSGHCNEIRESHIVDLNDDSNLEVFFFCESDDRNKRGFYLLDSAGDLSKRIKKSFNFNIWHMKAFNDLDSDGFKEILCTYESDLICLDTRGLKF